MNRIEQNAIKVGLYCGSWGPNIGNAFLNLGAKVTIQNAFPNSKIYPIGCASHWFFNRYIGNKTEFKGNSFEIGEVVDLDIIVVAGMIMCNEFVSNNGITFVKAAARNVPILLLGTGSKHYTIDEADCFSSFMNSLFKYAVITRDDDSFEQYKGKLSNLYSGIDSAFFLSDYYSPPKLILPPFNVVNFDSTSKPPQIDHQVDHIIHTRHTSNALRSSNFIYPNTLISDVPEDYLTVYSQVETTYSDRVHACVATLVYGNKARLYSDTPRRSLFAKLNVERIDREVATLDMNKLSKLKQNQIDLVKMLITELVS